MFNALLLEYGMGASLVLTAAAAAQVLYFCSAKVLARAGGVPYVDVALGAAIENARLDRDQRSFAAPGIASVLERLSGGQANGSTSKGPAT
jgi:hypothetical protein